MKGKEEGKKRGKEGEGRGEYFAPPLFGWMLDPPLFGQILLMHAPYIRSYNKETPRHNSSVLNITSVYEYPDTEKRKIK